MLRTIRFAFVLVTWTYVLAIAAQVYFAALGVFDTPVWYVRHTELGWTLAMSSILAAPLALAGRFPWSCVLLSLLLFGLMFVQVSLVSWLQAYQINSLTALHPVNALLVFLTASILAWRSARWVLGASKQPLPSAKAVGAA